MAVEIRLLPAQPLVCQLPIIQRPPFIHAKSFHTKLSPWSLLFSSADEGVTLSGFTEKFKTNVIVSSDGVNIWMSPATFKSSCDMAVRFYPFDRQNCEMTFGSWTFDSRLVKMVSRDKEHTKSGWSTVIMAPSHLTCYLSRTI